MIDGLWTLEFAVANNRYGRGVVILKDGRLLGGDTGYYYAGTYFLDDGRINATANVIRYDQNSISVFGNVSVFELRFSGEINDHELHGVGGITGATTPAIRITGKKKEDW